ncbi:IS1 family transposase [Klebsiella sp. BIGb0407]|uniref:IS1 family transposase n=1 Tax=Klebsiella sp. BIGb0407 TaxID=2940603 RepID=UPI0038F6EC14
MSAGYPPIDTIACAEIDEQCFTRGLKPDNAYDRMRKKVVAHVFGKRTIEMLERLLALLFAFDIMFWMTGDLLFYEAHEQGKSTLSASNICNVLNDIIRT